MTSKRTIIFGAGNYYGRFKHLLPNDLIITAFADSNREMATSKSGKLRDGVPVITPEELQGQEYDFVLIAPTFGTSCGVFQQLKKLNISPSKIRFLNREVGAFLRWLYTIDDNYIITNQIGNILIQEKNKSDSICVEETFGLGLYRINIPCPKTVVIDFGMNIADVTLFFAGNKNVKKVYGYEPFPDTYQDALNNIELNTDNIKQKIETFCIAASDMDREDFIKVPDPDNSGGWSVIKDETSANCWDEHDGVKIRYRSAGEIIKEIKEANPDSPIVLKCDTEGSEFFIFNSIETSGMFDNIDYIMVEYHKNPEALEKILDAHRFRYLMNGETDLGMIYAFK